MLCLRVISSHIFCKLSYDFYIIIRLFLLISHTIKISSTFFCFIYTGDLQSLFICQAITPYILSTHSFSHSPQAPSLSLSNPFHLLLFFIVCELSCNLYLSARLSLTIVSVPHTPLVTHTSSPPVPAPMTTTQTSGREKADKETDQQLPNTIRRYAEVHNNQAYDHLAHHEPRAPIIHFTDVLMGATHNTLNNKLGGK